MDYYIVEEVNSQNLVKKNNNKEEYSHSRLSEVRDDDKQEGELQLDGNKPFQNQIKHDESIDLCDDKPLIEDLEPFKPYYSVKIPETAANKIHPQGYQQMNWSDYHNLDVINKWMENLENTFPSLCTVGGIGTTLEGRIMKILKVSNSEAGNTSVWIDAGVHAREWIAPAVNTFIADFIVRNFNTLPTCFTNKDWYFLPVANPDGYEYSHRVERLWRKNRALYGGQCFGVDINRNFSFAWGGRGSSGDPSSPVFRGREPFSEPESSAMRDILFRSGIQFKVYVTLHSYGQVIVFPFGYRDELCPDYVRLLEGATVMSKAIYASTGNTYKVGISRDVMYGASGTSTDWSYVAPPCGKTQVWECKFTSEKQRCFIKSLDTCGAINIWKEERSSMDIMVEGPRAAQVADLLHDRCIPYAVAISDVGVLLDREQGCTRSRRSACGLRRCMDWKNYHRLNVIYDFMDNLARECPSLCTVCTIGRTVEGRDIRLLKISNGRCNNAGVWLDGATHPREWISTAVVTYVADQLVRNFDQHPEFITNKDWYILPVVNPDGYEYTHTHDRMWRKNRARYGDCCGVDLNRNFSYGWGERGEEGSSEDPGNIFYRGPEPFSEPETCAIRNAICESDTKFKVFLSFHSYGEVIIFPWGYTSDPCPDYVQMLEAGTAMAKAIQKASGHTYKVGSTKDLMYYASGTSTDWSYAVANIPYSYMVELRGKRHRFLLPKEEIVCTAVEVLCGVMKLMEYVDKRCKKPCPPRPCPQPCSQPCPQPCDNDPPCRLSRSQSCRSSKSCKSSGSCRSARSHSCRSSQSQCCESSDSQCQFPSKSCNFT